MKTTLFIRGTRTRYKTIPEIDSNCKECVGATNNVICNALPDTCLKEEVIWMKTKKQPKK